MALIYEFGNSSNWNLLWIGEKIAQNVIAPVLNQFYPIPDFSMPFLITSNVIAVYIKTDSDPGKWRKGGYAS
jgi:hypothetical protein